MSRCPTCEHENPSDARFCGACGQGLPRRCAGCGATLSAGQRFCTGCGLPAGAGAIPAAPDTGSPRADPAAGADADQGERRHATVVFSDLSGYTALNERVDAEEVGLVMAELRAIATRLIESHGGIVNQIVGDEIMALFGIPQAGRDDAQRAVRAALALHDAVRPLAERHFARLGVRLQLHSGINSGWVVVRPCAPHQGRFGLTGDTVNTASRLLHLAGAGEVVVGDDSWRLVSAFFEAERLPPTPVRGKAQAVQPWRILREVEATPVAPLIGRDDDMHHAQAALQAALAGGAHWVVIRGEPGIGKSRLLAELCRAAGARGARVVGAVVPDFGPARGAVALRVLLAGLLGVAPNDDTARLTQILDAALPHALHAHALTLLERPLAGPAHAAYAALENAARERGALDVLRHLLQVRSRDTGLVLALEDLHWADGPALALLARCMGACATSPLLCAVTTRPQSEAFDAARRTWSAALSALTLDLGPLAQADALQLARHLASAEPELAHRCVERAGGNPLFLEQLLRATGDAMRDILPGSIQSLVLARLDRLAAVDKTALQAASVLGQRFDPQAWRSLLDAPPFAEPLVDAGLLRPEDDGAIQFVHALVRDGTYASLLKSRRRELHQRAAHWYRDRDAGLHAEHLALAASPLAAAAFRDAARTELAQFRYVQAMDLAQRGLACPGEDPVRHALELQLGEALRELGRNTEALAALERALACAGDEESRARTWFEMATVHRLLSNADAAWQALDAAQPSAERAGDALRLSRIHYLRGNLCFARGDSAGCREHHTLALALARRSRDALAEAQALSGLGDAHYASGHMRSALETFRRCVDACERAQALRFAVMNRAMVGWCSFWEGHMAECRQQLRLAGTAARALAHRNAEAMVAESLGMVLAWTGDPDAQRALEHAVELSHAVGMRRFELISQVGLAGVYRRAGAPDRALALAQAGWRSCEELGAQAFAGPIALVELAACAAALQDHASIAALLEQADALLARGAVSHNHLVCGPERILLHMALGQYDEVLAQADTLERYAHDEPTLWATHHARSARALVRAARDPQEIGLRQEIVLLLDQARACELAVSAQVLEQALAGLDTPALPAGGR